MRNANKTVTASLETNEQGGKPGIWKTCLRFVVCIAILWFILSRVDLTGVYQLMTMVSLRAFALAFLINLVVHLFFVFRWRTILQALWTRTKLARLVSFHLIGLFFNMFLPTSVGGDALKAYYVSKDTGKRGKSFLAVFLDRYIGLLMFITFAAVAAFAVRLNISGVVVYHWVLLILAVAIVLTVLLSTDFAQHLNRFLGTRFRFIQRIVSLINESSKATLKNPSVMICCFLFTLVIVLLTVVINYILIGSIGCQIEIKDLLIFIPLIILATSLPISINGIGLRESAYIYFFSTVGFTAVESLALALLNFALLLLISLSGSLVYLLMGRGKSKLPSGYKNEDKH